MAYGDKPGDDPEPTQLELKAHRDQALASHKVPCRHCGASKNEPCFNKETGNPLRKFVAHPRRILDAKTIIVLPLDDEELPF
jgi:hypothetical protein